MANVKWKRRGKWMEDNILIISGYILNEQKQFIKTDNATTMINPMDFDHFTCVEYTIEKTGDANFPVKFKFGDVEYFSDFNLINGITDLACDILFDAVDSMESEEDEDITVSSF